MTSFNTSNFINDLTCPISLELLVDPISTNCCQKVFSRESLVNYILSTNYPKCPLCNASFGKFDAQTAPKNTIIASLVESLSNISMHNQSDTSQISQTSQISDTSQISQLFDPVPNTEPMWDIKMDQLFDSLNNPLPIAELNISLDCAGFTATPSLFILAVDVSGSMSGRPHRQCLTSLTHILQKTFGNAYVKTLLITYQSSATIVEIPKSMSDIEGVVASIQCTGGTNFISAFEKIKQILSNYRTGNFSGATIGFLTDGCDFNTHELPSKLKSMINDSWDKDFCVHSIAFGSSHDYEFLNNLHKIGTIPGTYRYTGYEDCDDDLCNKLTSLFDVVSSSSVVPASIKLPIGCSNLNDIRSQVGMDNEYYPIQFRANENGKGQFSQFVTIPVTGLNTDASIIICSKLGLPETADAFVTACPVVIQPASNQKKLFDKYFVQLVDDMATETLELSNKDRIEYGPNTFDLHLLLLTQRLNAISDKIGSDENLVDAKNRIEIIKQQIDMLKAGRKINQMVLNNLRFDSKFSPPKTIHTQPQSQPKSYPNISTITSSYSATSSNPDVIYGRIYLSANKACGLKPIHEVVISGSKLSKFNAINNATIEDFELVDNNGNTVLIWAAYTGEIEMIRQILKRNVSLEYINKRNFDGQNALEMALNGGYWISSDILIEAGATISNTLSKKINKLLYSRGHVRTAEVISNSNFGDSVSDITDEMSVETITYLIEKVVILDKEKLPYYMDLAMSKQMPDLVKRLISEGIEPTNEMLYKSIVPNSDKLLEITQLLLDAGLDSNAGVSAEGGSDTPLFTASKLGSIGHVKLFIKYGAIIDCPNELGNTSLWIACNNNRMDVAIELLNNGADPNRHNLKGNGPIMNCIQRGNQIIVQMLLMRGVDINIGNENFDSPIHIACRSGQAQILELLLNRADEQAITRKAAIDGFNPLFCAVEADKDKCVQILLDVGANIEDKTDIDNSILPGGTSLHLAALYNRYSAAKVLLENGANVNSTNANGDTILHTAVKQNNIRFIQLLRNYKVNMLAKDRSNKIAAFYCKNNADLKKELVDPICVILMKLAARGFDAEEARACEVLTKYCGVIGCLPSSVCVDVLSSNCRTPLLEAVIYSNVLLVKTLLKLGADPYRTDNFGLDCFVWSRVVGNRDITKLINSEIDVDLPDTTAEPMINIKTVSNTKIQNGMVLFLSGKPPSIIDPKYSISDTSNIVEKMNQYVNNICGSNIVPKNTTLNCTSLISFFDKFIDPELGKELSQSMVQQLIWNAKLFVVGMVASNSNKCFLEPEHLLSIYIYSSNTPFSQMVNDKIVGGDTLSISPFIQCFIDALNLIPDYIGEVYRIVTAPVDRKLFQVGSQISWPMFSMASLSWASDSFDFSSSKSGVIFLIKTKTAKVIKSYASNEEDEPVILLPNATYLVSNYYECSPICLGQKNIRNQTFGIKTDDLEKVYQSNENIIIELTEV